MLHDNHPPSQQVVSEESHPPSKLTASTDLRSHADADLSGAKAQRCKLTRQGQRLATRHRYAIGLWGNVLGCDRQNYLKPLTR